MPKIAKERPLLKNKMIMILCTVIFICFVLIPIAFLYILNPSLGKLLILFIFAPILGYLFYLIVYGGPLFLISLSLEKARSSNREIANMENEFHQSSRRLILKKLGLLAYLKFSGGINRGLNTGYEYCKNLLQHKVVESEEILQFYILMRLYECSFIDEKYERAANYLEMAKKIKPEEFLATFWSAETNELIGNAGKAVSIYQDLIVDSTSISGTLKDYLEKQIERVIKNGPKAPNPIPGLKYMPY